MRPVLSSAARALFTVYCLATAAYGLLAYLPFTYHQVLQCGLLPWLNAAARMHPWVNLGAVALVLGLLIEPLRSRARLRWAAVGLGVGEIAGSVAFVMHPVLPGLQDDWRSLAWSFASLAPPLCLAAIDIAARAGRIDWGERPEGSGAAHFGAAWRSAIFVTLLYGGIALVRPAVRPSPGEIASALGWSGLSHILIFLALFLLLDWTIRVARLFRTPAQVEFWLYHVLLAGAAGAIVQMLVWPALGFTGWPAILFAAALGLVLALQNASAAMAMGADRAAGDGIGMALSAAILGLVRSPASAAAAAGVLALGGGWLTVKAAAMDWNFTLQELIAAFTWITGFACFYGSLSARRPARGPVWLAVPLAVVVLYRGLEAKAPSGPALERWAGYDASYRLTHALLTPPSGHSSFYQFLGRNTSIPASVPVDPVPVQLTDQLEPSARPLPNIFILTFDSLRRDYLSPYNPQVNFTPAIESFARDSTVFRNAFTRYGGTGLSEPAIWSGAMLLHKQYVTPFRPMNALERLLEVEQFQVLVSRDSILNVILTPSPAAVELDPPDALGSYELARSLSRMEEEIDRRVADPRPTFGYTQPQNLHIAVIRRENATVPEGESYPGFYAPYASRLRRMDAAFGKFIEFLKARGLYDRSIIVLTADHGDSLGEDGRWGHAYTLYPEVVQIPLLVHLPPDLRSQVSSDPAAVAFNTDITPSLYYLLNHRPVRRHELFGRPLFTATPEERARDPRAGYLLAASYGPVYGILDDQGRRLYVADGVNFASYRFELGALNARSQPMDESFRRARDEMIRSGILAINRYYHFGEQGTGPPGEHP